MTNPDTITLPREVVERAIKALQPFAEHLFDGLGVVRQHFEREEFVSARAALTQLKEALDGQG